MSGRRAAHRLPSFGGGARGADSCTVVGSGPASRPPSGRGTRPGTSPGSGQVPGRTPGRASSLGPGGRPSVRPEPRCQGRTAGQNPAAGLGSSLGARARSDRDREAGPAAVAGSDRGPVGDLGAGRATGQDWARRRAERQVRSGPDGGPSFRSGVVPAPGSGPAPGPAGSGTAEAPAAEDWAEGRGSGPGARAGSGLDPAAGPGVEAREAGSGRGPGADWAAGPVVAGSDRGPAADLAAGPVPEGAPGPGAAPVGARGAVAAADAGGPDPAWARARWGPGTARSWRPPASRSTSALDYSPTYPTPAPPVTRRRHGEQPGGLTGHAACPAGGRPPRRPLVRDRHPRPRGDPARTLGRACLPFAGPAGRVRLPRRRPRVAARAGSGQQPGGAVRRGGAGPRVPLPRSPVVGWRGREPASS